MSNTEHVRERNRFLLLKFLLGNRHATHCIASNPQWLRFGAMFVLIAGFAREYDQDYLIAKPYLLALPFVASLIASFVIHIPVYFFAFRRRSDRPSLLESYRSFLQVFWATAPLALFYAIPYESFLDEFQAVQANLLTLALVSIWRVILIIRASSVLYGISMISACWPVLLFADIAMLVGILSSPRPLLSIMGGTGDGGAQGLIMMANQGAMVWGVFSLPVLFIATLSAFFMTEPRGGDLLFCPRKKDASRPPIRWAWCILLAFVPVLILSQLKQRRAYDVEQYLRNGKIDRALAMMSEFDRVDFPAVFDPRPRPIFGEDDPDILDVVDAIDLAQAPKWVTELYHDKMSMLLGSKQPPNADYIDRIVARLEAIPNGGEIARSLWSSTSWKIYRSSADNQRRVEAQLDRIFRLAFPEKDLPDTATKSIVE